MVSALQDDYEVFLEVGPAPVLTSLAQRIDAKKDNNSGGQPTMVAALRSLGFIETSRRLALEALLAAGL